MYFMYFRYPEVVAFIPWHRTPGSILGDRLEVESSHTYDLTCTFFMNSYQYKHLSSNVHAWVICTIEILNFYL